MYRKILVPLDMSEKAEGIVPLVEKLVPPGGEVVLLHVMQPFPLLGHEDPTDPGQTARVMEQERMKVADYLEGIAKRMDGGPVTWRYEIAMNDFPAEGIAAVAVRQEVDMVAMYAHDRRGLVRLIKRGIAEDVRRRVPIEVRVFRPTERRVKETKPAGEDASLRRSVLKEADVFKGLSDDQIDKVAAIVHEQHFEAGTTLGMAGEQGDNLFIILTGEIKLTAKSALGEIPVRIAGAGESWPLAVLVGAGELATSGKALTDLEVLSLPRRNLVALCSQWPDVGKQICANIAEVFCGRYSRTLAQLTLSEEKALQANIERMVSTWRPVGA